MGIPSSRFPLLFQLFLNLVNQFFRASFHFLNGVPSPEMAGDSYVLAFFDFEHTEQNVIIRLFLTRLGVLKG